MSWCHAGQQGSPRSGGVAATDASRVRLPSSEGLFFASRARHAAGAKAATDPVEQYQRLGQRLGRAIAQKARCAQRQCSGFLGSSTSTNESGTTTYTG